MSTRLVADQVRQHHCRLSWSVDTRAAIVDEVADIFKGLAGLTDRDLKLVAEGGYHTVESIAYT